MDFETLALQKELAGLELELQTLKSEEILKEEVNKSAVELQKEKWTQKHAELSRNLKDLQSGYEEERKKYEKQVKNLSEKLEGLREKGKREEEEERRFLVELDAELVAVAGRAKAKLREDRVSWESDTLQDSMCEETPRPDGIISLISNIAKAREILQLLLDRPDQDLSHLPPLSLSTGPVLDLPTLTKPLSDSVRDSSLYSKVLINDEILSSLTMSEREAVVYSIINAGSGQEPRRDVQLEDLLNITSEDRKSFHLTSSHFEGLSSIVEEEDSPPGPLTLTLPDEKNSLEFSTSKGLNLPMRLTLSPISSPRSDQLPATLQSPSGISSLRSSQFEDLDRGRIESQSSSLHPAIRVSDISLSNS